ncbi:MAG TPA: TetR/AcrR family transcriptional regulator [Mycobacteriales bacterium]|jgi:AcrR family transcriptional regulator|nr:TetR/AcrR family transcriptional regulator [Mycobacteriales bacterium]
MLSTRRIGAEDSATRDALLDAALKLLVEEGYASVTSRKVAGRAGLKPQLVHYYFRTMDDLFLALVRRGAAQNLERQARALESPQPLRALWQLSTDPAGTTFAIELFALANHRKTIRAELAAHADEFRRLQRVALESLLESYGVELGDMPSVVLPVLVTGLSQILVLEETLGVATGHAELRTTVEQWISRYEPKRSGKASGS